MVEDPPSPVNLTYAAMSVAVRCSRRDGAAVLVKTAPTAIDNRSAIDERPHGAVAVSVGQGII